MKQELGTWNQISRQIRFSIFSLQLKSPFCSILVIAYHLMKNMAQTDDLLLQSLLQDLPTSSYFLLPTQPQIIEHLDFFRLYIKVPNIASLRYMFFFSINHKVHFYWLKSWAERGAELEKVMEFMTAGVKLSFLLSKSERRHFSLASSLLNQQNNILAQSKYCFALYKNKGALRSWRNLQIKTTRGYNINHASNRKERY